METGSTGAHAWRGLLRLGGVASLLAGVVFRRNLSAEVSLFSPVQPPESVEGWYSLLVSNRLLALTYLDLFDIINYLLVAVVLLGLFAALRRSNPGAALAALAVGLLGIGLSIAANPALAMVPLSEQYLVTSSTEVQAQILAAGQALLAAHRFGLSGAHPGTAGYFSLLLIALSGLIVSLALLRSKVLGRASGIVGLITAGLDLAYCLAYIFTPAVHGEMIGLLFLPAAGLGYMVWHILIGLRLLKLTHGQD
jgi:hypothetical protein